MTRSVKGLAGAGEWQTLQKMLPIFENKKVLDLGCGFGWHCQYAIEHSAKSVVGVDISKKMLDRAKEMTSTEIKYIHSPIEEISFEPKSFDVVISSLTFHYLKSFSEIAKKVSTWLTDDGEFTFSVEHPIFTSYGSQDWYYDNDGTILHFPIDNYFVEGKRQANFLGEDVIKYHRTITTYFRDLTKNGFQLYNLVEPQPPKKMLEKNENMKNELRRPMMLIISARKTK